MENASKALIIAGAILLSILIISLGIMVYNNAKNTVGSANLNKQELQTFNAEWESYIGKKRTASEVRTMCQAVIANNASVAQLATNRYIVVTNTGTANTTTAAVDTTGAKSADITTLINGLSNANTYTVTAGYDNLGLVVGLDFKTN